MDRKSWHVRIRAALRESPRNARALAAEYRRAGEREQDRLAIALAQYFAGEAEQVAGDIRASLAAYRAALREFEALGESRLADLVRLSAVQVRALAGDKAGFTRDAAVLLRGATQRRERALVQQALGNGWRALGDETRAEKSFRDALRELATQRGEQAAGMRALLRQDLGVALAYRGATGPALRELNRAHAALEKLGQAHSVAMCRANRGWALGLAGDLREGWIELQESATVLDQLDDSRRAALARVDASEVRMRLGDFVAAAEDAAREARRLTTLGLSGEAARAWLLVARCQRNLGRLGRARQAGQRAKKLLGDASSDAFAPLAAFFLGGSSDGVAARLRRAGQWTWAVDAVLDQAEQLTPARGAQLLERESKRLPASLRRWVRPLRFRLQARAHPERGMPLLRKAVAAAEKLRALAPSSSLRATALARHLGVYEELAEALLARGRARDIREAFWVLDAARARTLREDLNRAAPGLAESPAIRRVRERIETLWRVLEERSGGSPGLRAASTPLLREIRRHEQELVRLLGDVSSAVDPSKIARPTDLPVCLAWSRVGHRLIGFLLDATGVVSWDAGSLASTRRDLDGLQFQVERRLYGATDHAAADGLLARIGKRLLPHRAVEELPQRLQVVLPLEIGSVPCEALPWKDGLLLDACHLEYVPCASWTPRPWRKRGTDVVIGLAARGLPEVDREVDSVARLRDGAQRLIGRDATRRCVIDSIAGKRIVHVAGHAEAREDVPPLSALRVRDGWITASDLAGAQLGGALVVLSACRTGDPALGWFGESLGGFPRAVLGAGAAGVLASRWPVRDNVAREWMESFYAALDERGVAGAAEHASQVMRRRSPHVADWGSFLLVRGGGQ